MLQALPQEKDTLFGLWDMPKPQGITCLEGCLLMGVLQTHLRRWWSSFCRRTSLTPELPMPACTSAELAAWTPPREGGLSSRAKIQLSRLQSRAAWAAHPQEHPALPVTGHTNTFHDPSEGGHSTAGAAGFQSHPKAKGKNLVQLKKPKI